MICLTCLLSGVPIILNKADITTIAPLNGYDGAMLLLQGGTRFFVSEAVETILQKKPEKIKLKSSSLEDDTAIY